MKRKIKAALIRFHRKQRKPAIAPPIDGTQHTCRHCGYVFVGRQCPMCGMPGKWARFTGKQLLYGFLDIWGMGNRPMFRSMGHLLWRPGYMIRDYLSGHYLSYFPPFKMLAVLTILVTLTIWLFGIDTNSPIKDLAGKGTADFNPAALELFFSIRDFFRNNVLYRLLLEIVGVVAAVRIVFHKQGLNWVETFFAMVYISCQMQLVTIAWLLLTRRYVAGDIFPYALPNPFVIMLLILDFRQLYGLRLWGAVWRTLLTTLLLIALYLVVIFAITLILFFGAMLERWLS